MNTVDNARLDISPRGLWNNYEKTFFDIRISHSGKSFAEIYQQVHNQESKAPLENLSSPLEKYVIHSLKVVNIVHKIWATLRKLFTPSGVPSWLRACYQQHKKESDKYNQRVIDIEKSSFNPFALTTSEEMAPECTRVNKKHAEKIAEKRREPYASVMTYIRTKLRFTHLRSTLAAIQGFQGK